MWEVGVALGANGGGEPFGWKLVKKVQRVTISGKEFPFQNWRGYKVNRVRRVKVWEGRYWVSWK